MANIRYGFKLIGSGTSEEREARRAAASNSPLDAEDPVEMPIITPLKELNIDVCFANIQYCFYSFYYLISLETDLLYFTTSIVGISRLFCLYNQSNTSL